MNQESLLLKVIKRVRKHGLRNTYRYALFRLNEESFDLRHNVTTATTRETNSAFICEDSYPYSPTLSAYLTLILNHIPIKAGHDVFLDFGSGLGRVAIAAAKKPFRRVIGVEISSKFNTIARLNLARVYNRLACKDINLVNCDAQDFIIPDEVTVIYFCNPFKGAVLERVCENIQKSLSRSPRPITIVFIKPDHFDPIVEHLLWIKKTSEVVSYYRGSIYTAFYPQPPCDPQFKQT